MRIKRPACAAAFGALVSSGALALDAATDSNTPPRAAGDAAARSAKSLECSQKADAQDLRGKARKHFLSTCKHAD